MPYAPGVVDNSGQIRAQGMMQATDRIFGGFEKGMEELKRRKEEEKTLQATVKTAELMSKGLDAVASQLGPEYKASLQELQVRLSDPNLSIKQKAELSAGAINGIKELMGSGIKLKQMAQQAEHQKAMRDLQLKRLEQGPANTEALRNTEVIIAARIAAGELDPNDKVAISKLRADLMSLGGRDERTGQPYQSLGPAQGANGEYVGERMLDKRTGDIIIQKPGQRMVSAGKPKESVAQGEPVPEGVKPTTASGLNRAVLNGNDFLKLRAAVTDDEISLGRFSRYIENVENASQGIETLADRFSTAWKTLTDSDKGLTPQEIARARASGQLQGLIGQSRLEVLGGGVLTEQDAVRIIDYLGGDSGALRNKELVKKAIGDIYQDKYKRYSRGVEDYNTQVKNYYGGQGYKPAEMAKYDERMFSGAATKAEEVTPEKEMQLLDKQMAEIRSRIERLKAANKK